MPRYTEVFIDEGDVDMLQALGTAFHSGGFAYNPVSGLLLAEFVAEGRTSVDVSAYSPDRFDPTESAEYLASTLQQKDAGRRRH